MHQKDYVEVAYCVPGGLGRAYASGSTRMYSSDISTWLRNSLEVNGGGPVLVTKITIIQTATPKED